MKDKKTIIGILLIVVIMVAWGWWMAPTKAEREQAAAKKKRFNDSVLLAERNQFIADSIEFTKATLPDTLANVDSTILNLPDSIRKDTLEKIKLQDAKGKFGAFATHGTGNAELITVETEKFLLTFNTKGGVIYRAQMLGYQTYNSRFIAKKNDTLDLWIPNETNFSTTLPIAGAGIETSELYFSTRAKSTKIKGDEKTTLSFRVFANNDSSKYLEYNYTISGNNYMIDFDINTVGLHEMIDPGTGEIPFTWTMATPSQEHEVDKERENSNIYYQKQDGDVSQLKGGVKGTKGVMKEVKFALKWVSFKQQFFSAALIPNDGFKGNMYRMSTTRHEEADLKRNKTFAAELGLPYLFAPKETFKMRMYLGPNHRKTLVKYDLGLEDQIDIGSFFLIEWINLGVIVVFNFFAKLGWNYGIIILMLTLIIKLITMPLTYKTFVSSAKMRLLKPDIDALGEKFKPEEAMAKQQAVMQLYRKAGVSPLSGCIPALLQMPILFAMIAFFPGAFELRQEGLLWANDLSTYDSILDLPFNIPAYGNHVSLFALLMTISTIFYTKMNSSQMTATGGMQAQQMKIMMYLMPVVFLVFLNSYSAALSYYYFLSNLISILLMLFIRKFMIDEKKLHAQIEENKKKAPKKSKWMTRMEEIQKARTEQMRQQQKGGNKGKKK